MHTSAGYLRIDLKHVNMSLTPASHHLTSDFEHQQHYWYSTAPYSGSVVRTYEYLIQCMDSPKASYTSVAYQVESDTTLHTTMVVGRGSRSCCAVCGAVEACVLCVGPVCSVLVRAPPCVFEQ